MRDVLCSFGKSTKPGIKKDVRFIRELTEGEGVKIDEAHRLLRQMTEESPLAELQEAEQRLASTIADLRSQSESSQNIAPMARRVQAEFKIWLSAFRSFDDRFSKWLSDDFGEVSYPLRVFRSALSEEYDTNFAYRLSCSLRNSSEHAGRVINHLSASTYQDERGGVRNRTVIALDGPRLAEEFPKLKATVRKELRTSAAVLHVEPIVRWSLASCVRAYSKLFDSIWSNLSTAVSLCESLHREALQGEGEWAVIIDGRFFKGETRNMTFRHNPWDLAELVRLNRQNVDSILSTSQPTVTIGDLVRPDP